MKNRTYIHLLSSRDKCKIVHNCRNIKGIECFQALSKDGLSEFRSPRFDHLKREELRTA
jgi:hypothetical protein